MVIHFVLFLFYYVMSNFQRIQIVHANCLIQTHKTNTLVFSASKLKELFL